jgi:ABC-type Zn2+ transport system substrate-binding protein/surface adhesin
MRQEFCGFSSIFRLSAQDEIPVVPIEHIPRHQNRKLNYAHQNGGIPGKKVSSRRHDTHDELNFHLLLLPKNPPMTEVTNTLNIDPSLLSNMIQLTDKMRVDLQQVTSRLNTLEQKVRKCFSSL